MIEEKNHYGFVIVAMLSIVVIVFFVVYMVLNSNVAGRAYQVETIQGQCSILTVTMTKGGVLASCDDVCGEQSCTFSQMHTYDQESLVYSGLSTCDEYYRVTDDLLHIRECVCCGGTS